MISLEGLNDFHGLNFANAKSGKRKSKKETAVAGSNLCDIPEDQIPFELPENWSWCRLGDLGITNTGTTLSKNNPEYFGKHIDFFIFWRYSRLKNNLWKSRIVRIWI